MTAGIWSFLCGLHWMNSLRRLFLPGNSSKTVNFSNKWHRLKLIWNSSSFRLGKHQINYCIITNITGNAYQLIDIRTMWEQSHITVWMKMNDLMWKVRFLKRKKRRFFRRKKKQVIELWVIHRFRPNNLVSSNSCNSHTSSTCCWSIDR